MFKSNEDIQHYIEERKNAFHAQVEAVYREECIKCLKWFKSKFPKRHLEWKDGMGTGNWFIDGEILDWDTVTMTHDAHWNTVWVKSKMDRKAKVLEPLWNFFISISDTANIDSMCSIDDSTLNTIDMGIKPTDPVYITVVNNGCDRGSLSGTCNFESEGAAINYYSNLGYIRMDVQNKINEREIHIGQPECPLSCDLLLHRKERRYFFRG